MSTPRLDKWLASHQWIALVLAIALVAGLYLARNWIWGSN